MGRLSGHRTQLPYCPRGPDLRRQCGGCGGCGGCTAADFALRAGRGAADRIHGTVLPPLREAARRIGEDLAEVARFTGSRIR